MADQPKAIENLLTEERLFPPSEEFVAAANVGPEVYDKGRCRLPGILERTSSQPSDLVQRADVVLDDSNPPFFKWFSDGELNVSYNCLDRHLDDKGDKVAFHWVGEPGDSRDVTYTRSLRRGNQAGQRPEEPRCREGRQGRHLPRHGCRASCCACWHVPASVPSTPWCSVDSPRTRLRTGSRTLSARS